MNILIYQPLVPLYRVPFFNMLAENVGDLTIVAGGDSGSLKSITDPAKYKLISAPVYKIKILNIEIKLQPKRFINVTNRKVDFVILPWDIHYIDLLFVIARWRFAGVPIALWGHGYSKNPNGIKTKIRNFVGKMSNGVILYTDSIAQNLIEHYGFSKSRVYCGRNSIDQEIIKRAKEHWTNNPDKLVSFQKINNINPAETVIFVSRLEPDNNISQLLHGFKALLKEKPTCKLIIVGSGSEELKLKELSIGLKIDESVIFTGAIYNELDLAPYMLSASVFCYPKNIGLSILHAFGYGLPVVTGDNISSHNPEIEALIDNENGLLFKENDLADMVAKLRLLIDQRDIQTEFSRNALRAINEKYNILHMTKGFIDCINMAHN